jgi:MFS family permease
MFFSASPALIIACAIVRGTGFGVFVVAAMATITAAMPAARRGLGAGLFGAASGLAGIAGSPAGPWIVSRRAASRARFACPPVPDRTDLHRRVRHSFTFLPLVIASGRAWLVSGALLTQQLFAVTARWLAGPWGDRHGSQRLLVPAIVPAAGGHMHPPGQLTSQRRAIPVPQHTISHTSHATHTQARRR